MNITITQKRIIDLCGTVSFKKGDYFYRGNKVHILKNEPDICEAVVQGVENFHVTIKNTNGNLQSTCSCSSLLTFKKACQHVAATFIALKEQQLTNGFMSIFENKPKQKRGHQQFFETREELDVEFLLAPIHTGYDHFFALEMRIHEFVVNIRDLFKKNVVKITSSFTYDREKHCFSKEVDEILSILNEIVHDEIDYEISKSLIIPPSSFERLIPLMKNTPNFSLQHYPISIIDGPLPIHFCLEKAEDHYLLFVNGYEFLTVFHGYGCVLFEGKLYLLQAEDFDRFTEIMKIIPNDELVIEKNQLDHFLNNVVPKINRIGEFQLSSAVQAEMRKTPLVAKLYLDRLKNRLLASIEFHYENVVIQQLEHREFPNRIIRDLASEENILTLMRDSGFTITEGGYYMQNEELEYDFLYHVLPKLSPLTQIYMTTAVRTRLVKEHVFPKIRVKVQKERTDWLEFKFEMDGIKDRQIQEFLKALKLKQKYYRLPNGSLLSLETKEMEEIHRFLNEIPEQETNYEATFNIPITESLKFLDIIEDSDAFMAEQSFRDFVNQLLHPEKLTFEVPDLNAILRDYQKQGYQWMKALSQYGFGGVLADDMGLGKTLQSITFIVSELGTIRQSGEPVLIVCPSSLTYNWLGEMMNFAPQIQAIIIDGKKEERERLQKELENIDVIITSYPLLLRDRKWYENQKFHTVFFDEAQNFKNPMTQTFKVVKNIQATNRFGLTGTPIENSLEELWAIYHVVFPHLFQKLEDFSYLPRKNIARKVRPFLLRRTKNDVLTELPGKEETIVVSELEAEQKKLYAAFLSKLRHDAFKALDQNTFHQNRIRILAGLTRLRQICCHPALFVDGYEGSSAKFEQLLQILEESRVSGRRVLIFSQFTKMLQMIGRELTNNGQSFFYLDGQTPSEERVELCHRFNEGQRDIFLISLKAGGTGLNLTGADTVILYDLWWNPAVEQQAMDRAYRMGQKRVVQVIKMIAKGTIEEKMYELQEKKKDLISSIIEPRDSTLTVEDIREILMI
ncbi:SNF2 family DNA or RNA helicase [Ureibacillus xyleni]|uniref:SNF2 family DNA or RNA helicase n=1 Tax=Ureibacillus xyleni TaxID=614648 RepID=A0A285SDS8_9BACL|nr:DEAD/DEAH box helicase [Ureibacillus xyleni]SOC06011.1 SNF2 family DNA or RNA helicase [Ureibacillus xyleni]